MYHKAALLNETIDGLAIKSSGKYADVTYGAGGHSKEILKNLNEGQLFAFDQDPDAEKNVQDDERLVFIPQNFSFLQNYLRMYNAIPIDGLLADLGVSFHQFDVAERGFSFRFDGPLDMRMDKKRKLTAAKVLNEYSEEELIRIFKTYGELSIANKVVVKIMQARVDGGMKTITDLKTAVAGLVPEKVQHKFLAQVFQAIRIEVNEELKVIEDLLKQSVNVLAEGGMIAVITYHSLEDRMVKNFFRSGNVEGKQEKDFYGNLIRPFEPVNRKPIVPTVEEIKDNNRARSAKLRIAKRLADAK